MKVGVLGGGISGLGVAYFLQQSGMDVRVLEKESRPGGLCQTFTYDGYTFDHGPHILFSKDTEILEFQKKILSHNLQSHRRNNKVFFKKRFMKYPFENDLARLDKPDLFNCLYNYIHNDHPKPANFKEWMYHVFGKGIADLYLIPYNEKIWATATEKMSCDWVEGRVPKPPVEDVIKSAIGIETEGYTHQLNFFYPKTGGIEELCLAVEKKLKPGSVVSSFGVTSVEKQGNQWVVSNGTLSESFDRLIVAMPIFHFVDALKQTPSDVKTAAKSLRHNATLLVLLGLKGDHHTDKFGVYVPEKEIRFHRLSFYRFLGSAYVPEGHSSVQVERTVELGGPEWKEKDDVLISRVIDDLDKNGLVPRAAVEMARVHRIPYAYVVYDLPYNTNIGVVNNYFRSQGIPLCGRFAEFKYYNTDQCLRSAFTVATNLANESGFAAPFLT